MAYAVLTSMTAAYLLPWWLHNHVLGWYQSKRGRFLRQVKAYPLLEEAELAYIDICEDRMADTHLQRHFSHGQKEAVEQEFSSYFVEAGSHRQLGQGSKPLPRANCLACINRKVEPFMINWEAPSLIPAGSWWAQSIDAARSTRRKINTLASRVRKVRREKSHLRLLKVVKTQARLAFRRNLCSSAPVQGISDQSQVSNLPPGFTRQVDDPPRDKSEQWSRREGKPFAS